MRQREIAELIVKQNSCDGFTCCGTCKWCHNFGVPCPLNEDEYDCRCTPESMASKAQRWLDDHKMEAMLSEGTNIKGKERRC